MDINSAGISLIKSFEGLSLKVYSDIAGFNTVGYGHKTTLPVGSTIDQATAESLFSHDVQAASDQTKNLLTVELNDNQFSALVSFVYNLGSSRLSGSHLLKYVNSGELESAQAEFEKWDHSNGVVVPGLLRRRIAERELFQLPIS